MKQFILFLFIVFAISCNRCKDIECAPNDYFGQFRIINKTDGKDLVFGSSKMYDKNQIKFYSLQNTDTTFYDYKPISYNGPNYDSILTINFYPQTFTPVYVRLSSTDTDTLTMTFKTFYSDCCGTSTAIDKFIYNNQIQIPNDYYIQEIKK